MRALLRALGAELRALLGDRGTALVVLGGTAAYAFFSPLPYLGGVIREVPLAVADMDGSAASRQLARMVDATPGVDVCLAASDGRDGEELVRLGKAAGVLVIPRGFQQRLTQGEQAVVQVEGDGAYFMVHRAVLEAVTAAGATLSAQAERRRTPSLPADPVPLHLRYLYNPASDYGVYLVPAVLLLVLQQTMLIVAGMRGGALREDGGGRQGGAAAVAGRALALVLLYLLPVTLYLGTVYRVFGFPHRASPSALALFLLPYLAAVACLGSALGGLLSRREDAVPAVLFTSIPVLFLSGFSWPREAFPPLLRALACLLPSSAGIDGFLRLNQMGAGLWEVRAQWLTLWALTLAYGMLSWGVWRRGGGGKGEEREGRVSPAPA